MPPLSRAAWPAAVVVAFAPTWWLWEERGTTVGKRLLGPRVEGAGTGKAVLRALLFPVAVLWPSYGVLWLAADVLWSFVDHDGRLLHDHLLGTSVRSRS